MCVFNMQCQCRCLKKYKMKHFMILYKDYTSKSPDNNKICSNKVEDVKQTFLSHQATVSNLINNVKEANTVLYEITKILAKKHVADGDMIKKCVVLASNSLLNKSKNTKFNMHCKSLTLIYYQYKNGMYVQ